MENLTKLRVLNGKTQAEMAEIFNLARTTYQCYEQGKSEPSIETLKIMADFFNVSVDYLIDRQNKNAIQIESLTESQRKAMHEIKALDDEKVHLLLGYIQRLKEEPLNNVVEKILKGG